MPKNTSGGCLDKSAQLDYCRENVINMKFLRFFSNEKADVIIDSSGASTVNILETILSPQGKKELRDMAEFAEQHNLRQPQPY